MSCPKCGSEAYQALRDGYLICARCGYIFGEHEAVKEVKA